MKDPEHNCAEYTVVPLTLWMSASCLMACYQWTVKLGYDGSGWFLILLGVLFDVLVPFERPGTAQYGIRWPSSCPSKNKDNHESMSPQAYCLKHSGKLWKINWFVNFRLCIRVKLQIGTFLGSASVPLAGTGHRIPHTGSAWRGSLNMKQLAWHTYDTYGIQCNINIIQHKNCPTTCLSLGRYSMFNRKGQPEGW